MNVSRFIVKRLILILTWFLCTNSNKKYRIYFRKELAKTICASKSAVPAVPKQKSKTKKMNEKIKAVGKSRPTRAHLDVHGCVRAPIKQLPPQWALAFQINATWQPVIQVGCFHWNVAFIRTGPRLVGGPVRKGDHRFNYRLRKEAFVIRAVI